MTEDQWDRLLRIRTSGRDDSHADQYRFPYEPTPYRVLERLAGSGYITKHNTLIDYGCGKGRVDFFLSYQIRCRTIGVEYDRRIYEAAVRNKKNAVSADRVELVAAKAEGYKVPLEADRFYFFNPFSVELLQKAFRRIRESRESHKPCYESGYGPGGPQVRQDGWIGRDMLFFFYYPSYEYVSWLMTVEDLMFLDEIDCMDLFEGADRRERILVFEMI